MQLQILPNDTNKNGFWLRIEDLNHIRYIFNNTSIELCVLWDDGSDSEIVDNITLEEHISCDNLIATWIEYI